MSAARLAAVELLVYQALRVSLTNAQAPLSPAVSLSPYEAPVPGDADPVLDLRR